MRRAVLTDAGVEWHSQTPESREESWECQEYCAWNPFQSGPVRGGLNRLISWSPRPSHARIVRRDTDAWG